MLIYLIFFTAFFTTCFTQHNHGSATVSPYDNCMHVMTPHGNYHLEWSINEKNLTMMVMFQRGGLGWSGIGFNKVGQTMLNASMILGYGNCNVRGCHLNEYFSPGFTRPRLNPINNLLDGTVEAKGDMSTIKFVRPLNNEADPNYFNIKNETITLMLAFNNITQPKNPGDIGKHTDRPYKTEINLYHSSMGHYMYFHYSLHNYILFEFWKTTDYLSFILSTVGLFLLSIFSQILLFLIKFDFKNYYNDKKSCKTKKKKNFSIIGTDEEDDVNIYDNIEDEDNNNFESNNSDSILKKILINRFLNFIVKGILFFMYITLANLLMLVVMTYNIFLFSAIVLGNTVGWTMFSWSSFFEPEESCH